MKKNTDQLKLKRMKTKVVRPSTLLLVFVLSLLFLAPVNANAGFGDMLSSGDSESDNSESDSSADPPAVNENKPSETSQSAIGNGEDGNESVSAFSFRGQSESASLNLDKMYSEEDSYKNYTSSEFERYLGEDFVLPPTERRAVRPFTTPHLTNAEINRLAEEISIYSRNSFRRQHDRVDEMYCVSKKNGWLTVKQLNRQVNIVNMLFGRFNDFVNLLEKRPSDDRIKEQVISLGLVVLYEAYIYKHIIVKLRTVAECDVKMLRYQIGFIDDIIHEVGELRLRRMIDSLADSLIVMSTRKEMFAVQLAILLGESNPPQCNLSNSMFKPGQIDTNVVEMLNWCGFDARLNGRHSEAENYFNMAKINLGNPRASWYASDNLRKMRYSK